MPIIKTKGGYKFGEKGKVYKTREEALKQMRAIKASQAAAGKKGEGK